MRALALLLSLAACRPEAPAPTPSGPPPDPPRAASADTVDVQRVAAARAEITGDVTGTVTLREFSGGTRILMRLDGLGRDAFHGVQILSVRSCGDATEAVPLGDGRAPHGPYDAAPGRRRAGDLGNIEGNDRGTGRFDRIDPNVTLTGYLSAVGRAVVIREAQDDGWTKPHGGAGGILGCGVLEPAR
ncbi:MAG: superoxide dismutase family protein [Bacteroidota bacterium]